MRTWLVPAVTVACLLFFRPAANALLVSYAARNPAEKSVVTQEDNRAKTNNGWKKGGRHHARGLNKPSWLKPPPVAPVPEPASLALMAMGLIGLVGYRKLN